MTIKDKQRVFKPFDMRTLDVPVWYELGLDGTAFVLKVRSSVFSQLRALCRPDSDMIKGLATRLKLPAFSPLTDEKCGFGRVLHRISSGNGCIVWRLPLQPVCGPSIEEGVRWDKLLPSAATLAALLFTLFAVKIPCGRREPQLFAVLTIDCGLDSHVNSFTALISRFAVRAVLSSGADAWSGQVRAAMRRVHSFIFPEQSLNKESQFGATLLDGRRLHLRCPGDACDLSVLPEGLFFDHDENRGHNLVPHNLDSPLQQLTLLAGLAALSDRIRELQK